jgi:hypothetical protein
VADRNATTYRRWSPLHCSARPATAEFIPPSIPIVSGSRQWSSICICPLYPNEPFIASHRYLSILFFHHPFANVCYFCYIFFIYIRLPDVAAGRPHAIAPGRLLFICSSDLLIWRFIFAHLHLIGCDTFYTYTSALCFLHGFSSDAICYRLHLE